jgi:cytochrome c
MIRILIPLAALCIGAASALAEGDFEVSEDILALEGDVEYGAYLSGECTTCHLADGGEGDIPQIHGLGTEYFVTALHAYKAKHLENEVMQMIAGRMSDDEIAALAAYFQSLEQ